MPKAIRDAHACCALYLIKNRFNGSAILHSIELYVDELLRSDPTPTLQDRLSHAQALVLYHIICLLDGDIRARVSAESQLITLEESACALLPYVDFDNVASKDEILPLYPIGPARAIWHDWILHESARRAYLFSLYFIQAYGIVSGLQPPYCDSRLQLCRSLAVSTQLWNSRCAVTFAKAWNQRGFFIVTDCSFDALLRDGKAEDMDTFAKMLMSSAMGIEEAEGRFTMRGSSLRA
ncbi:hypothetical protein EDB81DRAFT_894966 [Dactylonectria macrodidyma]|uniref:Uncharacterized protein n=1 Tax=Dactylonectria macrodidyma TaxID=307937 RepID=A0A9P9CZK2_9HYPO|nr:hypothetical protein EDB81DRAFT_894966 [Dactylonectria macrodidyma]